LLKAYTPILCASDNTNSSAAAAAAAALNVYSPLTFGQWPQQVVAEVQPQQSRAESRLKARPVGWLRSTVEALQDRNTCKAQV
jgi:hypothetical protein